MKGGQKGGWREKGELVTIIISDHQEEGGGGFGAKRVWTAKSDVISLGKTWQILSPGLIITLCVCFDSLHLSLNAHTPHPLRQTHSLREINRLPWHPNSTVE